METNKQHKMTLEEIASRKAELKQDLEIQKNIILASFKEVSEPFNMTSPLKLVKNFSSGFAIFEGVMFGLKIIRRVRGFFK